MTDVLSTGTKTELSWWKGTAAAAETSPPPLGLPLQGTQWDCQRPAPAAASPGLSLPHLSRARRAAEFTPGSTWQAEAGIAISLPPPPPHSRTTLGNVLYTISQSFQQDLAA